MSDHATASVQPGEPGNTGASDNNNNNNSSSSSSSNLDIKQEQPDASIVADAPSTNGINPGGATNMDHMNNTPPSSAPGQDSNATTSAPTASELRIPAKKDASLREFLSKMDDYAPIIPDAVTNYYLTLAGLPPPPHTPPHLARLLALATQKFIADVAADAYQYSRIRSSNTTSNNPLGAPGAAAGAGVSGAAGAGGPAAGSGKDAQAKGVNLGVPRPGYGGGGQGGSQGRTVLTMEDLGMAVGEYGVNVKRGEFYR